MSSAGRPTTNYAPPLGVINLAAWRKLARWKGRENVLNCFIYNGLWCRAGPSRNGKRKFVVMSRRVESFCTGEWCCFIFNRKRDENAIKCCKLFPCESNCRSMLGPCEHPTKESFMATAPPDRMSTRSCGISFLIISKYLFPSNPRASRRGLFSCLLLSVSRNFSQNCIKKNVYRSIRPL